MDGVFRVRYSETEPEDAAVSIFHRGVWFYIPDNDLDTKATFLLVQQLIQLHSATTPGGLVLCVNVGG